MNWPSWIQLIVSGDRSGPCRSSEIERRRRQAVGRDRSSEQKPKCYRLSFQMSTQTDEARARAREIRRSGPLTQFQSNEDAFYQALVFAMHSGGKKGGERTRN